jgi:REP element-mobilizing transposase RayT
MRVWLLTNTYYGNWLPGDERGSVTSVRNHRPGDPTIPSRIEHDVPGTPYENCMPGLQRSAAARLKSPPVHLNLAQANCVLKQFRETAAHRSWIPLAAAIMHYHFHLVVQVPGDPSPDKILVEFKAYASRRLNQLYGRPKSETWWTSNGSKRKLADEAAVSAAVRYVLERQPNPLVVWSPELPDGSGR